MSDTVHYSELGLVNTREMFAKAVDGGYAIPAYNFNNLEQLQAIISGCAPSGSPVIIQVSRGARKYASAILLRHMAAGAVEVARDMGSKIPISLHLDHGDTYDLCVECIESGFSSVMIDGSAHSFEDNIALTRKVVEYARPREVSVEGELGVLSGIEDDVSSEVTHYTRPEEVEQFLEETGVDSLAISIGTSHGAFKFNVASQDDVPPLRFDILEEIEKRIPGFPIVLHGASSVVPEFVEMINEFGGDLAGAVGVPEWQLRKAAESAVCKINIDSDGRLAMTGLIRKHLVENPKEFDPRKYIGAARDGLAALIEHKNKNVLGSAGRY